MKRDEQSRRRPSLRVYLLAAFALVMLLGLPAGVSAQNEWTTNGTNINNATGTNVGINNPNPLVKLDVITTGTIYVRDDTAMATGVGGGLTFWGKKTAAGAYMTFGAIRGLKENATDNNDSGYLSFQTIVNNGSLTERMRVSSVGNVGIGTTNPGATLDVSGNTLTIGSDSSAQTRTNATTKLLRLSMPHYTNAEAPFSVFAGATTSTNNIGAFGGGAAGQNAATQLQFYTGANTTTLVGTERMRIDSSGNVGIGTTAPNFRLDVNRGATSSDVVLGIDANNSSTYSPTLYFRNLGTAISKIMSTRDILFQNSSGGSLLYLKTNGSVGIGTNTPDSNYKLDVVGDVRVSGNIAAKYQDMAEWVASGQKLAPGTVVVLDTEHSNQVMASTHAYDTKVAGVVSAQPGVILGEAGESKSMVATTGRVRVKVDATNAPIKIGDLLVTSDREGVAMKSEALMIQGRPFHTPGTLIGKALEPLEKGIGEILVLLSLQ
jgi:hypothetical protein